MQYTLENTAEATHVKGYVKTNGDAGIAFYKLNNNGSIDYLDESNNYWSETAFTVSNFSLYDDPLELSRPQSDIDALFNDAPEWVTDYARCIKERVGSYYR